MAQHMCQFDGVQNEDPYAHISSFLQICDTFKANNMSEDVIRLRLFSFSASKRNKPVKAVHIYEVDALTTLEAQVEAISKRLNTLQVQPQSPVMSCEYWDNEEGPSSPSSNGNASTEQVDYVG
ncbi:uncharacterized protein LOC120271564 [Dioscorea cayenensis subsp. rotundata]|uniref:Uncharacterized protein LOC120271564 n=1 Tax=Dioscorea cayennensis subsp. rotundata TaxID=55577 RepID=A0AB40C339_DIOCR|nr:uncharacterized protein LOC120271564 [Dioscorea cayenensis subsp. rotundata]